MQSAKIPPEVYMKNISPLTFRQGLKDGVPIALGYLSVSFAFGATAVSKGIDAIYALLMSMTNLTSAGQLAGAEVISSALAGVGGGVIAVILQLILTQLIINARYFLMSISLSQKVDDTFTTKHRLLCSFGVTDEIFAVAVSQKTSIGKDYMYGLICLPYIGWATGTITGALFSSMMPDSIKFALGIALYAMFIAIILPPTLANHKVTPVVLIGAGLSCLFYYLPVLSEFTSQNTGIVYIICAIVASVIGALIFPVKEEDSK